MPISESELILNSDGSIYHLNLFKEEVAETIITVGDPGRVHEVSKCFDSIEFKKEKREFNTHTGYIGKKRISVISSGIGTDNIDIVLNEVDALYNVDLVSRRPKEQLTKLNFIRIGTSGALQGNIPLDSFVVSEFGIGLEGLLFFYQHQDLGSEDFTKALVQHLGWENNNIVPYVAGCDKSLLDALSSDKTISGCTLTNGGFYGPQGRSIRLKPSLEDFFEKLSSFRYQNKSITNLEMETAAIYGLSKLLGHKAVSINVILANRETGDFSKHPKKAIEKLIEYGLEKIEKLPS